MNLILLFSLTLFPQGQQFILDTTYIIQSKLPAQHSNMFVELVYHCFTDMHLRSLQPL